MSKCYVIKNKEGKYWCGNNRFSATLDIRRIYFCEDFDFISKVINKLSTEGLLTDCTIVPITISEGDLEEKYEVLKGVIHLAMDYACKDKKLYKRIQDFNVSTNRHNGDNNVYLEDAVCFLTKLSKDARDDAKKWGEFFEKVYQEQQAKESEKNGV